MTPGHDLSVGISSFALAKIPDLLPTEIEMRAMLPVSVIDIQGPALGETATSVLNYFNLIVYLISNEMLIISADMLTLLEIALSKRPFLALLLKKTPASRAFIQQVSKAAIKLWRTKVISTFLNAGIFFDAWTVQPDLPLKLAIEERNTSLATRLIEAGADLTDDRGCEALSIAAEVGDLEFVTFLLEMGANPNPQDTSTCYHALFEATARNDKEMVELLLDCGADINMSHSHTSYPSPLVNAAQRGDLQLVQALLHHNAHTEDRICRQQTALGIAADQGHSELARELLDAGASVHPPTFNPLQPEYAESSALYKAVERGHRLVVQLLLRYKADPNTRRYHMSDPDATGRTALFAAVTNQNKQIVQDLLDAGARINEINLYDVGPQYFPRKYRKETALHQAVRTSNAGLVQILLNAGAVTISPFSEVLLLERRKYQDNFSYDTANLLVQNPNSEIAGLLYTADPSAVFKYGTYFLQSAIQSNDIELARVLLNAGVDVNGVPIGSFQGTAFQHAVSAGNSELAKVLLECGAIANAPPDKHSRTALQTAVNRGSIELVQMLLSYGANANAPPDKHSRTALQAAVDQGSMELVQMLLSHGANVNAPPDKYSRTALQTAVDRGSIELVQMLLSHGANVNTPLGDSYSSTALHSAVDKGRVELVQVLLSHGADVNAHLSKFSRTALQAAVDRGSIRLVRMLLSHGADIHAPGTIDYGTALQSAAEAGDVEVVKLLLHTIEIRDSQANVSDHHSNSDTASNDWRSTMLPAAARGGLFEIARLLLTEGADINTVPPGTRYGTALQEAVDQQDLTMVHLLLDNDADPNIPGPVWVDRVKGWRTGTPLQIAVDTKSLELIHILVEAGARADILSSGCNNMRPPLEAAMENFQGGYLTMVVRLLLAAGADVNLTSTHSRYLGTRWGFNGVPVKATMYEAGILATAIERDNIELFQLLLDSGANINSISPTEESITALQAASQAGHLDIVETLLRRGVEVDGNPGFMFGTALQCAVARGHAGIAFALLEAGADPTLAHSDDIGSPLVTAAVKGRIDTLQMFLNAIKSRGTSGQLYVELLESSLEMALKHTKGVYTIAMGMIKTEIEDSKSA
jgi:ankyrin repeat protein